MLLRRVFVIAILLLPACTAPSPLLRQVHQINANGSTTLLRDADLSPFQKLVRSRLPARTTAGPNIDRLFALEVDVPEGEETQGAYMVILQTGGKAELRYFEQVEHKPRFDRYYYRSLTPAETSEFQAFLKAHPLQQLRLTRTAATAAANASKPADASPNAETAEAVNPGEEEEGLHFRLTEAQGHDAQTLDIKSPGADDHPAIDLIRMLARFRDDRPMACSYFQPIPPTAELLFADPVHRIMRVWASGDDIRAVIDPPLPGSDAKGGGEAGGAEGVAERPALPEARGVEGEPVPEEHWYAYRARRWVACDPPPVLAVPTSASESATTEPATQPTSAAAGESGAEPPAQIAKAPPAATEPLSAKEAAQLVRDLYYGDNTIRMPDRETWYAEPGNTSTEVWHFIPVDAAHGLYLGFVVPAFIFDTAGMCVDAPHNTLYLIHEGQLFALPIPASALAPH